MRSAGQGTDTEPQSQDIFTLLSQPKTICNESVFCSVKYSGHQSVNNINVLKKTLAAVHKIARIDDKQ